MTLEELEGLSPNALKEYIRARFRRETADPPLGPPGDDYPHAYLVECDREGQDPGFRERLRKAANDLAVEWLRLGPVPPLPGDEKDYLWSFALLLDSLSSPDSYPALYKLALLGRGGGEGSPSMLDAELDQQILGALARVHPDGALVDFWLSIWRSPNVHLYKAAFFGLERANLNVALDELDFALQRAGQGPDVMDAPALVWRLIHRPECGVEGVVRSLKDHPAGLRAVRNALAEAGADEALVSVLEMEIQSASGAVGASNASFPPPPDASAIEQFLTSNGRQALFPDTTPMTFASAA